MGLISPSDSLGFAVIADSFKFTDLLIGCKVNYY